VQVRGCLKTNPLIVLSLESLTVSKVKPWIPPLPNPSPAKSEGFLAVASLVGLGLTWTARHGLSF